MRAQCKDSPLVKLGNKMLTTMQPLDAPQKRQEPQVWEQLEKRKMPGQQKDFVRKAPWKKLTVGATIKKAYHQPTCVMCSVSKTFNHVLSRCKFWPMACDIVTKAFGPMWGPTGVVCPMKRLLIDEPLLSLQTTQGLALWAAARAGRVLKCEAKFRDVSLLVSDFLTIWMHFV